jgi:CheY-like chemotaxis protein
MTLQMALVRDPRLILVVDDDPDLRESLRETLEAEGFVTIGASNGEEAIEILCGGTQYRPYAVLLDLMMPKMTGHEVFERLRQDRTLQSIRVVLMTAFRTLVKKDESSPVLLKPFKIEGVLAAIRRAS